MAPGNCRLSVVLKVQHKRTISCFILLVSLFCFCAFIYLFLYLLQFDDASLTEEQHIVRELVHTLFLGICCSFTLGINFYDKTFSTSGK